MIDWDKWRDSTNRDIGTIMDYWNSQDPKYFDQLTAEIVIDIIIDRILTIERDGIFRAVDEVKANLYKLEIQAIKYGEKS